MRWFKKLLCYVFNHHYSVVCEAKTVAGQPNVLYLLPPLVFICTRCGHREERLG